MRDLRKESELKRLKKRRLYLVSQLEKTSKQIKALEITNQYDISREIKKARLN